MTKVCWQKCCSPFNDREQYYYLTNSYYIKLLLKTDNVQNYTLQSQIIMTYLHYIAHVYHKILLKAEAK